MDQGEEDGRENQGTRPHRSSGKGCCPPRKHSLRVRDLNWEMEGTLVSGRMNGSRHHP